MYGLTAQLVSQPVSRTDNWTDAVCYFLFFAATLLFLLIYIYVCIYFLNIYFFLQHYLFISWQRDLHRGCQAAPLSGCLSHARLSRFPMLESRVACKWSKSTRNLFHLYFTYELEILVTRFADWLQRMKPKTVATAHNWAQADFLLHLLLLFLLGKMTHTKSKGAARKIIIISSQCCLFFVFFFFIKVGGRLCCTCETGCRYINTNIYICIAPFAHTLSLFLFCCSFLWQRKFDRQKKKIIKNSRIIIIIETLAYDRQHHWHVLHSCVVSYMYICLHSNSSSTSRANL